MNTEYLWNKLKIIENESSRKELFRIYTELLEPLYKYQDIELNSMAERMKKKSVVTGRNYGISSFVCSREKALLYEACFSKMIETGQNEKLIFGEGVIKTVFCKKGIDLDGLVFSAVLSTNLDRYSIKVRLKRNEQPKNMAERVNNMLGFHGIDIARINPLYFDCFYDVYFEEVEDHFRDAEHICSVDIEWNHYADVVSENMVLLWNIKPFIGKERTFPSRVGNSNKYRHEIVINKENNGFLFDSDANELIEMYQDGTQITFYTNSNTYGAWKMFEIVNTSDIDLSEIKCIASNETIDGFFEIFGGKANRLTIGEINRKIRSYKVFDRFEDVEVIDMAHIIFKAADDLAVCQATMEYIIQDLNEIYCTSGFHGEIKESTDE